jgi:hypothetical protein
MSPYKWTVVQRGSKPRKENNPVDCF